MDGGAKSDKAQTQSEALLQDKLRRILTQGETEQFTEMAADEKSWPLLKQVSPMRENLVRCLPIQKTDAVLEIGAGYGALTGALASMAGAVTAICRSEDEAEIIRLRLKERERVEIQVGSYPELEPALGCYDWILLAGSFQEAFLPTLKKHLTPGARVALAMQNRLRLSAFNGMPDEGDDRMFGSLEGIVSRSGERIYSRQELIRAFSDAGAAHWDFYYAEPDYLLPQTIWSDEYLPAPGEVMGNLPAFGRDRCLFFDETAVYDTLAQSGEYPRFASAFLVLLTWDDGEMADRLIFARFSGQRSPCYALRTEIRERKETKTRSVRKIPCREEGRAHLRRMVLHQEPLRKLLSRMQIALPELTMDGDTAVSAYVPGRNSLERACRAFWTRGEREKAVQNVHALCRNLQDLAEIPFRVSRGFSETFGLFSDAEMQTLLAQKSLPVTPVDFVAENLLYDSEKNGQLTLIDPEWTYDFPIPIGYVIWRMWHYFLAHMPGGETGWTFYYELEQPKDGVCLIYEKMEHAWQQKVAGDAVPLRLLADRFAGHVTDYRTLLGGCDAGRQETATLWYGFGSEPVTSHAYRAALSIDAHGRFSFTVPIAQLGKPDQLRFDPLEGKLCRVKDLQVFAGGTSLLAAALNGFADGDWTTFWTMDPAFTLTGDCHAAKTLTIEGTLQRLSVEEELGRMDNARRMALEQKERADHLQELLEKDPVYRAAKWAKKRISPGR